MTLTHSSEHSSEKQSNSSVEMKTQIETVSQLEVDAKENKEKNPFSEYLKIVKVHRFETGDYISIPTTGNDGLIGVTASEGGYILMFSKEIICVTDTVLENAKHDNTPIRDKFVFQKKDVPAYMYECSHTDSQSKPTRVYYCGCSHKKYDSISYNRWLEAMHVHRDRITEEEGKLWREVDGDKKPINWPDGWKTNVCTECGESIRVEDGSHYACNL